MPNFWTIQSLLQLLLASPGTCNLVENHRTLKNRQSGEAVVSGIDWRDANGNVPVRREIRDLKDNYPDQWNLYLLGLATFQWTSQNDSLSYYSLASIHGRPYRTWGDVPGIERKIGTASYCPHSNALFLGWHRPYLALFEKELYKHIRYWAVQTYGEALDRYALAANSFRMPYWDWAQANGSVPEFFTTEKIDVTHPDGGKMSIWNPLYAFYFHPIAPEDFDKKFRFLNRTQRWPTSDAPDSTSVQSEMLRSYEDQRRGLVDHIDTAFRKKSLNAFASTVEDAHGWVHGVIGGGWTGKLPQGHMWPLEYSAFEPMFMLHHTNVDRLYALYQAAHPDRLWAPQNIGNAGNVWLENGQTVSADTPLLPFRKPTGGFWTTNDARDTRSFGYAYPETVKDAKMSEYDVQLRVQAEIAKLYGSSARKMLTNSNTQMHAMAGPEMPTSFTDWSLDAKALASALPPSFVVRFSLTRDFSSDDAADVGSWVKLMPASHHVDIEKRTSTIDTTYQGSVSLTASLLDEVTAGRLRSLEPEDVVPYLKEKLSWTVISGDGDTLPHTDSNALTLEVVSTQAYIPDDPNKAIEYSEEVTKYPEVTMGKAGGVVGN